MPNDLLGWSQRYEQQIFHLMRDSGGQVRAACGAKGAFHGQVEKEPYVGAHRCKLCLAVLERRKRATKQEEDRS